MEFLLLKSLDNQVFLVKCTREGKRLKVGYGYFGIISEKVKSLYSITGVELKVVIPDIALNQYGCSQCNFFVEVNDEQ